MSVALEVFGLPRPELGFQPYSVQLCAASRSIMMRDKLFSLRCTGTLDDLSKAQTVIVPNRPDPRIGVPRNVLSAVSSAYDRGARILSFCTGSFVLADAGVLDGRRATTHWRWTSEFAERFPKVELVPDVLFVDDGQVLTAAGSAAALDLSLHIVGRDWGAEVAHHVSNRLVFAANRHLLPALPLTSLELSSGRSHVSISR
jgi:AraC family transcriptional regulator, transcriptional activator FtrA